MNNWIILLKTVQHLLYSDIYSKIALLCIFIFVYKAIVLKKKETVQVNLYEYKLNYYILNALSIYIYVGFYIYSFLWIRLHMLNREIDLKIIFQTLKLFCTGKDVFNTMLLCILGSIFIIIFFVILLNVHKVFIKELKKKYLFLFASSTDQDEVSVLFHRFFSNISLNHLWRFITNITLDIDSSLNILGKRINITKIITYIFFDFFFHFMVLYILYIILMNHGILTPLFNKIAFSYALYSIYKRISNYVVAQDTYIQRMLFNMYYKDRAIKYVNMPESYRKIIFHYIENGLQIDFNDSEYNSVFLTFEHNMEYHYTYTTKDGIYYFNNDGQFFEEFNNQSEDETQF
jgi:hypothetical protein